MASKRVLNNFQTYFSQTSNLEIEEDFSKSQLPFELEKFNLISTYENNKYITISNSQDYFLELEENSGLIGVIEIKEGVEFNLDFFSHSNSILLIKCIIKKGASCNINGYYSSNKDKNWIRVELIHEREESKSDLNVLGYNSNNSQCICDGLIQIGRKAQNSSGYQTLTNYTLSNTCKTYSEPQLEIFNPNVECSHGSTISPVDKNVLYYLESRGITEENSISMLKDSMYLTFLQRAGRLEEE